MDDRQPDHIMLFFIPVCKRLYTELITIGAKANDHPGDNRRQVRMITERLPGMNVRNMHFNRWIESTGDRIG